MNNNVKRVKDEGNFIVRYIKSFLHACNGIYYSIKYEHNIIIMLLATLVVTILGFYFQIKPSEWLFILFAVGSVTSMEMINSSIIISSSDDKTIKFWTSYDIEDVHFNNKLINNENEMKIESEN